MNRELVAENFRTIMKCATRIKTKELCYAELLRQVNKIREECIAGITNLHLTKSPEERAVERHFGREIRSG